MSPPLKWLRPKATQWVDSVLGNQALGSVVCYRQDAGQPYSIRTASNIGNSHRFETRGGDFFPGETDRIRSELQSTELLDFETEYWGAFLIRVNANPVPFLWSSCVIGQIHQSADAGDANGYPPFEFNIKNSGFSCSTATNATASDPAFYPNTNRISGVPFALNTIHSIVYKIKFSWVGNAVLQVWLNGQKLCDISQVSIGMNDILGPYFKWGVYWHCDDPANNYVQQVAAEYFHMILPTTRDLSYRITNVPPVYA